MVRPVFPLILCGGSGTRLWPASRAAMPKQFLPLFGALSPFQETVARGRDASLFGRAVVVTNAAHRFLVAEQLLAINVEADVILEPEGRDSGPAIAAGTLYISERSGQDAIVLALASDHVVRDAEGFRRTCRKGMDEAENGSVVVFGVSPSSPSSDYGYIECEQAAGDAPRRLTRFVEKPDAETASRYVREGFLWNSGNLLYRADVLLEEYATHEAGTLDAVRASLETAKVDLGFVCLDAASFGEATARSVDYAVLEHTRKAIVVPATFDWSDIGSWSAVHALSAQDEAGNATDGRAVFVNARNSYISTDGPLVSLVGLDDVTVIATGDAVMVARREDAAGVKALVTRLKACDPRLTQDHLQCFRPWGNFRSLELGPRHQVKRIVVKPGGQLSLQKHHHRSEHWIVVRGTARVTVAGRVEILHENQSIYVPIGAIHRMENPGKINLEIIEVQTGSYLGEDDIVRIEDVYKRVAS